MNFVLIILGKIISTFIQTLNLGSGSTWPGHIALKFNKKFIREFLGKNKLKIIVVAGTNGKTTTSRMIRVVLEKNDRSVIQNESGANLLNGIASILILKSNWMGKMEQDFAIFEIDENNLPLVLDEVTPDFLVILNIFRDQLDRYGEVNAIAEKWGEAIKKLKGETTYIFNADDPQVAFLGNKLNGKVKYFGFKNDNKKSGGPDASADSVFCPKCGIRLEFKDVYFSHLGDWICNKCRFKRPKIDIHEAVCYPLKGDYNKYNTLAAILTLREIGLSDIEISEAFEDFCPAFGRQEVVKYKDKRVQLFLSKNPTGFNQSYKTIKDLGAKNVLLVLNDRIPDGRDISWIWDTDLGGIEKFENISIAGDRVYDMALRVKYENESQKSKVKSQNNNSKLKTFEDLRDAVEYGVSKLNTDETLFVLPTYSAMLEVRKILTGKKIL